MTPTAARHRHEPGTQPSPAVCHLNRGCWVLSPNQSIDSAVELSTRDGMREVTVAVDVTTRADARIAPELAIAKLELRQICLLAAFEILTLGEQDAHRREHTAALAAGRDVIGRHATAPDRDLPGVARLFLNFTYVFPNLGLAGPIKDAALLAARESICSGASARDGFTPGCGTTSATTNAEPRPHATTPRTSRSTRSRPRPAPRRSSATAAGSTP